MSLRTYISRIRRLDAMIRSKSTGPPEELADKLDISERWLYRFLGELKEEFGCPITYDYHRQSYVYEIPGKMMMDFKHLSPSEKKHTSGGYAEKSGSLYLFVQ